MRVSKEKIHQYRRIIRDKIDGFVRDGRHWPAMSEQCAMNPAYAVAWQAAMILERKRKLLTTSQTKLDKAVASKTGYINRGLTLSPAHEAAPFLWDGYMACAGATKACIGACVGAETGQGRLPSSKIARIGRTLVKELFRAEFEDIFDQELRKEWKKANAKGYRLAFRFNVASDHWQMADKMAGWYPDVTFYDYTAITSAMRASSRVRRVYSRKDGRDDLTLKMLREGHGVAVVFDVSARKKEPLPKEWNGYPVIDGDINDLWFLRAHPGCAFVVGLRVKGDNKQIESCRESGFAAKWR